MKSPWAVAIFILTLVSGAIGAMDDVEKNKIEFLISSVETLQGAKFIRNGSEYEGKAAADHLRMKLKMAGREIKTADDFIRLCASKSYISGTPYLIRFSDGKTIEAEVYFREKLKEYPPAPK